MLSILLITLLGILIGIFTGLTPGIHPNTLIAIALPALLVLPLSTALPLIASTAVSHSLLNHIPSILLGAPDKNSALAALPGKKLLLQGKAWIALDLGLKGGLYSTTLLLLTLPLLYTYLPPFYSAIEPFLPYLLTIIFTGLILRSSNVPNSSFIVLLCSGLGILSLHITAVPNGLVLFPLLTGLFGASTLLSTLRSATIPEQQQKTSNTFNIWHGSIIGSLSGIIAGMLPGLGPSGTISLFTAKIKNTRDFLTALGGINTADSLASLTALLLIGRARSGASVAIQKLTAINTPLFLQLVGVSIIATAVTYLLGQHLLNRLLQLYNHVNTKKLLKTVLLFLLLAVLTVTGISGLGLFLASTSIGLIADNLNVQKSLCMACLVVPVILLQLGLIV